ncbi:uncharacterized protein LOC111400404 [Olea europaea var. sylvestris]|uniref:uncharacterized protein LOC111400404 n=1 Tax=Olea europaea var. sylvestris TaxID=158386 RepID=UPI000C1D2958|nr:uncharacterized protein LOC111400404 [Olea europaea var. sylvestris]
MRYFSGMEILRSKKRRKYTLDILTEIGMLGCKPSDKPIEAGKIKNAKNLVDMDRYQRLVGKLIYLSHTRLDIAFAVSIVSQFMHSLNEAHLEAIYKILIYLKGSTGKGLFFEKNKRKKVKVFTNANWVGSIEDSKSTIGYCTFVWRNLVTWRSKKPNVVAKSSVEVEFRAVAQEICE